MNAPENAIAVASLPLAALGAQRARLANLLQAFLAIDDWTDDSIATPELIAEAKAALADLEGLTFEAAA